MHAAKPRDQFAELQQTEDVEMQPARSMGAQSNASSHRMQRANSATMQRASSAKSARSIGSVGSLSNASEHGQQHSHERGSRQRHRHDGKDQSDRSLPEDSNDSNRRSSPQRSPRRKDRPPRHEKSDGSPGLDAESLIRASSGGEARPHPKRKQSFESGNSLEQGSRAGSAFLPDPATLEVAGAELSFTSYLPGTALLHVHSGAGTMRGHAEQQ